MKRSTVAAGAFAVLGIVAAVWMVFGPMIERWWKTPAARPVEHVVVETELDVPNYSVLTSDEASLAQAIAHIEAATRDLRDADSRVRTSLTSTDRAAIAREVATITQVMLSGSVEALTSWLKSVGAQHPILDDPDSEAAGDFVQVWTHNGGGLVGSPIDPSGIRMRVRYLDGRGPFEAPEDELYSGHSFAGSDSRVFPRTGNACRWWWRPSSRSCTSIRKGGRRRTRCLVSGWRGTSRAIRGDCGGSRCTTSSARARRGFRSSEAL